MPQTTPGTRPAATDAPPKISYEDFLVQYNGVHAEWVDGEVELALSVSDSHQRIGNFLFRLVAEYVEAYELGRVFQLEFQMKLAKETSGREPDLFFVPNSKLTNTQSSYFDGPADLVIEIVSTDSIQRDYEDKFKEYQSGGVLEYWLIDPLSQQVNFFQRDANGVFQRSPSNTEGVYDSSALSGFWVREEWFWQSPAPSMSAMRKEFGLP